jgi:multiple sugar transport system substrate-binding protein
MGYPLWKQNETKSRREALGVRRGIGRLWNGRLCLQRWPFWGLVLSTLVLCRLLIACTAAPPTLAIAMSGVETERWAPLVAEFERQHPDIRIRMVAGPNNTNDLEKLYTDAFQQTHPRFDLVYADTIWVPRFAAAGWLMDLGDRISAEDLADFLPGDLAGGRYQQTLYRLPLRSDIGVLHYRKDLLAAAGLSPPVTFEDLMTTAAALQAQQATKWGYVWQGRPYEGLTAMFMEVLAGHGGFWLDPDTLEIGLMQPEALQAVNFLRRTIQEGISPSQVTAYSEEETYRLFQQGEVAFLRNWTETWATINSTDSPVSGQIGIQPMVHVAGQQSRGCQGGWGLAIAQGTRHADAAWEFVKFFTGREAQRQFVLQVGYLPSRKSLYTDPLVVQQYDYYPDLLDLVQQSVLRPPIAEYTEASAILQRYLHAALTDLLTPEQAMQAAVEETQRLFQLEIGLNG